MHACPGEEIAAGSSPLRWQLMSSSLSSQVWVCTCVHISCKRLLLDSKDITMRVNGARLTFFKPPAGFHDSNRHPAALLDDNPRPRLYCLLHLSRDSLTGRRVNSAKRATAPCCAIETTRINFLCILLLLASPSHLLALTHPLSRSNE